jgi:hypothetical protein
MSANGAPPLPGHHASPTVPVAFGTLVNRQRALLDLPAGLCAGADANGFEIRHDLT